MATEKPSATPSTTDDPQEWYVNTIWGRRISSDNTLFEIMSLQVFQAGLTWNLVLNRRNELRSAFARWNIETVAAFGASDVEALLNNPNIIRNQRKIQATIRNARTISEIREKHGSFCKWFYEILEGGEYLPLQEKLQKTFSFMGPEISRMWLMASGRITKEEGDKYQP